MVSDKRNLKYGILRFDPETRSSGRFLFYLLLVVGALLTIGWLIRRLGAQEHKPTARPSGIMEEKSIPAPPSRVEH